MKIDNLVHELDEIIETKDGKTHICVNMTNGLEVLDFLPTTDVMFTNIQSTQLEQKNFESMMNRLGADFLMKLALGHTIYLVDFGAKKECSRACYQGVPFIIYALQRAWFNKHPEKFFIQPRSENARPLNVVKEFDYFYRRLSKPTVRYLKKFRPYAKNSRTNKDDQDIHLIALSASTDHDADKNFYLQRVNMWEFRCDWVQVERKIFAEDTKEV